jgi:hypothetical protein
MSKNVRPAPAHVAILIALVAAVTLLIARSSAAELPPGYEQFTNDVTVWANGGKVIVTVQVTAVPNHNSPYFPIGDPRYEAYNGPNPNYMQNPNQIVEQTIEFALPADPQPSATHPATPLGPIGVALNGVPFFNQYAGPNTPLTFEINSFDQYNGHPQMQGVYHYHVQPLALTAAYGPDALLGFLLDGYPVYGPEEGGQTITNADLDQYHGHAHATGEYPQGMYHYHVTTEAPYINGAGFYGEPGTVGYQFSPTPTPSGTIGGIAERPDASTGPEGTGAPLPASESPGVNGALVVALAAAAAGGAAVLGGAAWYARRRGPG